MRDTCPVEEHSEEPTEYNAAVWQNIIWAHKTHFSLPQTGIPWQTKVWITWKTNLVNQRFNWGYLQECGWGVTYRSRDDSKTVVLPKPTPAQEHLKHTANLKAPQQERGLPKWLSHSKPCQLGWFLFLPGSWSDLKSHLYSMACLRFFCIFYGLFWKGGAWWIWSVSGTS